MKTNYRIVGILFIWLTSINILNAQEFKRNNNWTLGFTPVAVFDFNSGSIIIDTFQFPAMSDNSCISDTSGSLLFFTTGFAICNKEGLIMQNGLDVNCPNNEHILADYYSHRSLFDQTSIILPKKGNTYYVFSTGMSDSVANNYLNHIKTEFDVLNYSIVDMDSNSGKGKVTIKNKILQENQHYANCALTAVKHGNGKDWWLVKADCENNRYQTFIVTEDTILGPYYQQDGNVNNYCVFSSQIYFSDDGTKFASTTSNVSASLVDSFNQVNLYYFDRCTGQITFIQHYIVPYDLSSYPDPDFKHGICFSPNGKLLYMSNRYTIYQIDLEDTNIFNGIFISGPDTIDTYFARYSLMACGPDGKLYIGNRNGTRPYMSYIDKPNIKGLGCDFKANGLWQPYTNLKSPPNMPNYGLGPLPAGVNCWPVQNTDLSFASEELVVYPNPSYSYFYFKNKKGKVKELYNSVGQLIISTTKDEINVSSFAKGLYYLKCDGISCKVIIE